MKKYVFLPLAFALMSCGEHSFLDETLDNLVNELRTGWLANEEDLSAIPQDIMSFTGDVSTMPSKFLFEDKFPPIGQQGNYGTCVAWAVGYNLKTALNGMDNNWSSSDLAKPANQTSPKDLWMTLPSNRNANCGGTNFEWAMEALITKGAASLAEVPYSNMGNCSEPPTEKRATN
jgi:C1A family cysteine protease